jgi:hypothetical protein
MHPIPHQSLLSTRFAKLSYLLAEECGEGPEHRISIGPHKQRGKMMIETQVDFLLEIRLCLSTKKIATWSPVCF